ncbi:MAG: hypothetical protein JW741_01905 [Sedimentisphaerales bacterium]|nr:hypothetical protein [Sedimentisphaerales bacterium]
MVKQPVLRTYIMAGARRIPYHQQNVADFEDLAEFNLLSNTMLAKLAPVGCMETLLAEHIVSLSWRLKRAAYMQNVVVEHISAEAAKMRAKQAESVSPEAANQQIDGHIVADERTAVVRAVLRDFGDTKVIEGLRRYERQIQKSLRKAHTEYQRFQRHRQEESGKGRTIDEPPTDW